MAKQKVEIELDVPDGYEATGEFRTPLNHQDIFVDEYGNVNKGGKGWIVPRLILRRVKQYREPVLTADYGKSCEFSDDGEKWVDGALSWWHPISGWCCSRAGEYWKHCRIEKEST